MSNTEVRINVTITTNEWEMLKNFIPKKGFRYDTIKGVVTALQCQLAIVNQVAKMTADGITPQSEIPEPIDVESCVRLISKTYKSGGVSVDDVLAAAYKTYDDHFCRLDHHHERGSSLKMKFEAQLCRLALQQMIDLCHRHNGHKGSVLK